MRERVAVRFTGALGIILTLAACSSRLDEQKIRARLVEQLRLPNDQLRVISISPDAQPIAALQYDGVAFAVRFRRQDRVWVIDAVRQDDRWEPAGSALPHLARDLSEKARARWLADVMPRYARTLRLLTGWATILANVCTAMPPSQKEFLDLHEAWHRKLFRNRGTEYHDADLFVRHRWLVPLRSSFAADRVEARSSGEDRRMDTPDDVRLVFDRTLIRGQYDLCLPHYTVPSFVVEAGDRPDAPAQWNISDLLPALRKGHVLEVVEAKR